MRSMSNWDHANSRGSHRIGLIVGRIVEFFLLEKEKKLEKDF